MGPINLVSDLVGLYKKTATELPEDILNALKQAEQAEEGGAKDILGEIITNAGIAGQDSTPICQDTGVPIFYVQHDGRFTQKALTENIIEATRKATSDIPLRPNSVSLPEDKNSGDNTGELFPVIHFEEIEKGLIIELMLKGGGSENISQAYKLPDDSLGAGRDIEGVKKCVIDAVLKAQGRACPPYIIGVAIGGSKDVVASLSKKQLLRNLNDESVDKTLSVAEKELKESINTLGIGPAGLGGKTTCLAVKIAASSRHPASYFVDVSFCCWACRRGSLSYG